MSTAYAGSATYPATVLVPDPPFDDESVIVGVFMVDLLVVVVML